MKLRAMALAAAGLLLAPSAFGGPYDQPYGKIETGDRSTNRKHEPATINRIDGQSTSNPRRPNPVAPGKHDVEISFSSSRVAVADQLKTIVIDVEPCKRYRVVAHYHNPASGKWEPVVQAVEDIGECRKKFQPAAPKK